MNITPSAAPDANKDLRTLTALWTLLPAAETALVDRMGPLSPHSLQDLVELGLLRRIGAMYYPGLETISPGRLAAVAELAESVRPVLETLRRQTSAIAARVYQMRDGVCLCVGEAACETDGPSNVGIVARTYPASVAQEVFSTWGDMHQPNPARPETARRRGRGWIHRPARQKRADAVAAPVFVGAQLHSAVLLVAPAGDWRSPDKATRACYLHRAAAQVGLLMPNRRAFGGPTVLLADPEPLQVPSAGSTRQL